MNSILEFEATKAAHGKMDGINFYQYVQSFKPTENITPRQAHEIAKEFAVRAWPGAEVLVATHCDTDQYSSELSKMLSDGREELHRLTQQVESSIRKIIVGTAVSSAALSVLVCLALLHWAG